MASAAWFILALVLLVAPPVSVVGLLLWTRRLRRRGVPRVAAWVAYCLAAIVGLVTVAGHVGALRLATDAVGGEAVEPSQKARSLAEGISEALNCGALALLVVAVTAAWLAFWGWRLRGGWKRRGDV